MIRLCKKCYKNKYIELFVKRKEYKYGRSFICKQCDAKRVSIDRKQYPERVKNSNKKGKIRYKNKFPSRIKTSQKTYASNNLDVFRALAMKRYTSKLQRTPPWLTKDHYRQIEEFYIIAQEIQWLSEEKLHVDHIIPLQGRLISGLHVPWNLQVLPSSINLSKSNKLV